MNRFFLLFFCLFASLEASDTVLSLTEKYPEILWLADANVRKTEEGQAAGLSHSEQFFGKKFIEFDRTVMTLHCLHLILDGSDEAYELFSQAQPEEERISRNSFISLYLEGQAILKSGWKGLSETELLQALETALVLGDIGKSEKARELFGPLGIKAPDHDDFNGQVMRTAPDLCPSFACLPQASKELLIKTANLAHFGHIFHLEGGPSRFTKLKESELAYTDPFVLVFELFVQKCDVAGALGHVNRLSSLAYREKTHQGYQSVQRAIFTFTDTSKTEKDAYDVHLSQIAEWLELDPNDKIDRVLARIGAMLRLYTKEKGTILKEAMAQLDNEQSEKIALQLNGEFLRTPTYVPAFLLNLSQSTSLTEAITIGLPFVAHVFEQHRASIEQGLFDPTIPLNFNTMAGIAKTAPYGIAKFHIDDQGNVLPREKEWALEPQAP